jgi:hypothetical protein
MFRKARRQSIRTQPCNPTQRESPFFPSARHDIAAKPKEGLSREPAQVHQMATQFRRHLSPLGVIMGKLCLGWVLGRFTDVSGNGLDLRSFGRPWTRLSGGVHSVLFLLCLTLLPASPAWGQATVSFLSPDRIAQGYPLNASTFRLQVSYDGFASAPAAIYWNNGGSFVQLPFSPNINPGQFSATVDAPAAISATLGNKTIRVCPVANPLNAGCTSDTLSEKLAVLRPQVTDVFPERVTQGAPAQVVDLEYILPRSDSPVGPPTVYLVNSQGQETLLTIDNYFGTEGQVDFRFVSVNVPATVFANLGIYKFRIVETYDVGPTPQQTDINAPQAGMEVVAPAQFTNSSPLPPAQVGVPYNTVIAATGGVPYPGEGDSYYFYFVDEGSTLPSGLFLAGSFDLTAPLQGTTNGPAGIYTFTLGVEDRFGIITTKQFRMGVQTPADPLSITTTTLPQARVGEFYFSPIAATGGVPGYTFAIAEGGRTLPTGLELQPDGTVVGVPTTQGTFIVDIYAEDSQLRQATKAISITILPPYPPVLLTSASPLPPATATQPYDFQFGVTGGRPPYFFYTGEVGNPPAGLTLSSTGRLTGTPTTPGTYQFGVGVFDSRAQEADSISDFKIYTLVVQEPVPPPEFITEANLPMGEVGTPYQAKLEATGGVAPLVFLVGVGNLPPGLGINENTGVISGTPTAVTEFTFPAEVRDARGRSATKFFKIVIVDERQPLVITTASPLPEASLGDPYSTPIVATGGLSPYAYSVTAGTPPAGLSLNPQTGILSGTPTQAGSSTFTVRVASSDNQESVTREFQIQVLSTVRLITQSPLPEGLVGSAYSLTFAAERGTPPYQFSVIDGQLPSGLTLNAATGALTGTPTAPFDGTFTVQVRDAATPPAQASRAYQLRILQPLEFTLLQLPAGTVNVPYQAQFGAQGGVAPYSFSLASGTLPSGISLTGTGLLAGTATSPSASTVVVRVTDSRGTTVDRNFTLNIQPQAVNGGSLSLSSAVGVSNTQNEVDVTISAPQSDEITGTVTLSVNSQTNPPVDDPTVQFISGGRTANFTIPAGQTSANFGQNPTARFQTGTTAATLVFTAAFRRNGQDATPSPAPQASLAIPVTPPTLSDVTVTRSGNALTVVIRGFAPERNITTAVLEFTRRPGAPGTSPERFDVNVSQAFQQWFSSTPSQQFGSQFRLTIPVTLSGDPADITGLSVRLAGPAGTGNTVTATF